MTRRLLAMALVAVVSLAACGGGAPTPTAGSSPTETSGEAADGALESSLFGFLSKTYVGTQEQCLGSTRAALANLGLEVTEESGAIFKREFEVEATDGTSAIVVVSEVTKASSRIEIKVGYLFGNADAARRIHSEIEAELATRRSASTEQSRKWKGVSDLKVVAEPSPGVTPSGGIADPASDRRLKSGDERAVGPLAPEHGATGHRSPVAGN